MYASLVAPFGARHDAANRVTPGCRMLASWRMVDVVIGSGSRIRVEVVPEKTKVASPMDDSTRLLHREGRCPAREGRKRR
jgi:hypothetical protein